jgi:hypothetical protein
VKYLVRNRDLCYREKVVWLQLMSIETAYSNKERCHGESPSPGTLQQQLSVQQVDFVRKKIQFILLCFLCVWNVASCFAGRGHQLKFSASNTTRRIVGIVKEEMKDVYKIRLSFNEELCELHKSLNCDMTPERRKCAVREAPQRRPLLDNDSLGTCPQQRTGLWKPKRCCEINTCFRSNKLARE